jgi:hypothetical protein
MMSHPNVLVITTTEAAFEGKKSKKGQNFSDLFCWVARCSKTALKLKEPLFKKFQCAFHKLLLMLRWVSRHNAKPHGYMQLLLSF